LGEFLNGEPMDGRLEKIAELPVAFAQVREDPLLDLECCRGLDENSSVVMIASGGDTVACLAGLSLGRLVAVDMNPAQLALTRCKLHLADRFSRDEALAWLGHLPMSGKDRYVQLKAVLESLELPESALGPLDFVAEEGPDFSGRYERLFFELQSRFDPKRVGEWLHQHRRPGPELEAAFDEVMALDHLILLFGPEATQNPLQPFSCHFAERSRIAIRQPMASENPFLWQLFLGRFPDGRFWDWLMQEKMEVKTQPEYVCAPMNEALIGMEAKSADFIHLSNILDWLDRDRATDLLANALRVLKPGGCTLIRQLNSSLNIPGLQSGFFWDEESSRQMVTRDRSFFYPQIHLGRKR